MTALINRRFSMDLNRRRFSIAGIAVCVLLFFASSSTTAGEISIYQDGKGAVNITDQDIPYQYERKAKKVRYQRSSEAEIEAFQAGQRNHIEKREREIQEARARAEEAERQRKAEEARIRAERAKAAAAAAQEARLRRIEKAAEEAKAASNAAAQAASVAADNAYQASQNASSAASSAKDTKNALESKTQRLWR